MNLLKKVYTWEHRFEQKSPQEIASKVVLVFVISTFLGAVIGMRGVHYAQETQQIEKQLHSVESQRIDILTDMLKNYRLTNK